jgi:hypothetical protein
MLPCSVRIRDTSGWSSTPSDLSEETLQRSSRILLAGIPHWAVRYPSCLSLAEEVQDDAQPTLPDGAGGKLPASSGPARRGSEVGQSSGPINLIAVVCTNTTTGVCTTTTTTAHAGLTPSAPIAAFTQSTSRLPRLRRPDLSERRGVKSSARTPSISRASSNDRTT